VINDFNPATRVVIEQTTLQGSNNDDLQRVATVYFGTQELQVWAPSRAAGKSLDWVEHFSVFKQSEDPFGGIVEVPASLRLLAIKMVEQQLHAVSINASKARGKHPDGEHCWALICVQGHVLRSTGFPDANTKRCPKCGSECIESCNEFYQKGCQEKTSASTGGEMFSRDPAHWN
jgi:hypothetical protein